MSALQMTCGFAPGPSGTPVLETGRLLLRAPKLDDAKVIARLANNRKIAEMTALIPHPYGVDDAKAWIESLSEEGQGWTFAVTAKTEAGSLSPEQRQWGDTLKRGGGNWAVWRPRDLFDGSIGRELASVAAIQTELFSA